MEFEIKPPHLIILKYLKRKNNKAKTAELKRDLIGRINGIPDIIESLWSDGYINISEDTVISLSPTAISYLYEYDNFGSEYIFKDDLDFAIAKFLYEIDAPVNSKWFPSIIQEKPEATSMANSEDGYNLEDYIVYHSKIKSYIINNESGFSLKQSGKDYYLSMVKNQIEKSKKIEAEINSKMLQDEVSRLTLESLKSQEANRELTSKLASAQLNEIKNKRKWAVIGALASSLLTLLIEHATDILRFLSQLFNK